MPKGFPTKRPNVLVLALPRGGVSVAYEVAHAGRSPGRLIRAQLDGAAHAGRFCMIDSVDLL